MIDNRTENYFNAIKNNMNYIGTNYGWCNIEEILKKKGILETANLQKIKTYDGYVNSSNIDIYSYEIEGEKRYCAELSYQTDIDDYCIETHIFKSLPSRKGIITIRDIESLVFRFKYKGLEPEFTCWECGHHVHWLDRQGDFKTKKDGLEEKYCGC